MKKYVIECKIYEIIYGGSVSFGKIFKTARKNAKKTLREAAEHVGLSTGNISDIEHSRRKPPKKEVLTKLEKFYNLEKNQLVDAAVSEWNIPAEAMSIFSKRPQLTMSLLRATKDASKSELQNLITEFSNRRGKGNDI